MSNFDFKSCIKNLPNTPGVYKMLGQNGSVLYVGKAKNLKKRITSYWRGNPDPKTQVLIKHIENIEITLTPSENEALLLENNLIKTLKPRYNIVFKDDKSYPYLYVSADPYPRLVYYRGKKQTKGNYFGPYPNTHALQNTLKILQRIFKIRNCNNHFFKNRIRPCLQYEIGRCSAPCVDLITQEDYQKNVQNLIFLLNGKTETVLDALSKKMADAAHVLDFERATYYRNQIAQIRTIQSPQIIESKKKDILDIIGLSFQQSQGAVILLQIREGRITGTHRFFYAAEIPWAASDLLQAFLSHYYLNLSDTELLPKKIILPFPVHRVFHFKKIPFHVPQTGEKLKWLQLANTNAEQALALKTAYQLKTSEALLALQKTLALPNIPTRIEGYDISHLRGEYPTASCVVFINGEAAKNSYRQYHLTDITPGDDYGALYQTFCRRFKKNADDTHSPQLILIDGGPGQLKQAKTVLQKLGIHEPFLLAVAKGKTRKPGLETLYSMQRPFGFRLPKDSFVLHFIQSIRDEAHRFAITRQQKQTRKKRVTSVLEEIPGIGHKKRTALLQYFGGLSELKTATAENLCKVPGIHKTLAEKIVTYFHMMRPK